MRHLATLGLSVLLIGGPALLAQSDQGAKQDVKDAAGSTKRAAKKTGHKVKKGVKKGANKSAEKAEQGADKVRRKTE